MAMRNTSFPDIVEEEKEEEEEEEVRMRRCSDIGSV